jgi:probable phosphomutase (TIGR03848 family)
MATVLLVRHGRTTANAAGILAGRLPGVLLDDVGEAQAQRAADRIADLDLAALVSSPQERCRQTARFIASRQPQRPRVRTDKGFDECDYGDWQGGSLKQLARRKLWQTVQKHPSAAIFPGGESLIAMQQRAVTAIRRRDAAVESEHGRAAVWAVVSHGDLIKAVLADALGMHLDLFQRIHVDPASISIIRYTDERPYVLSSNSHAGTLDWLRRQPRTAVADVGGGAGPGAAATPTP